ncbi:MAG TPA: hypothetical protein DFR83_20900 [Deltaproteobacteria bacterium]|nr:hypothetical protein [Deltaproteobacteria bacterium]
MSSIIKILAALVALLVLLVGGFVAFVFATEYAPEARQPEPVHGDGNGAGLVVGSPFTVVSWNLQYSASRKHRFFYDGGEAVHVPEADVQATVAAIGEVLAKEAPAVALLQEIDRDSARTGRVDQLPPLVSAMNATAWTAAAYHKAAFVPKPFSNPLGRVQMDLGILTTGRLENAERHQLALMDEPRPVQALNLKRALLTAEVPVEGLSQPLAVGVTHLSAFSFGDGTLEKQVAALKAWMAERPEGQPWILAGDFNLLPPGDDKSRLRTEAELYADEGNPIDAVLPAFRELFGAAQLDPKVRTYLPFGFDEPDRKIDYFFMGGPIEVVEGAVLREHAAISDHLPIRAVLRIVDPQAPVESDASKGAVIDGTLDGKAD